MKAKPAKKTAKQPTAAQLKKYEGSKKDMAMDKKGALAMARKK